MTVTVNKSVGNLSLTLNDGSTLSLSKLKGKNIVLYFYPKDDTPGCTQEGKEFSELHAQFTKLNTVVFGISRDSIQSHTSFKEKYCFLFALVSDADETLCQHFAVMKMKNMYGKQVRGIERSTFLIDSKGILKREWRGVKVPNHAQEVLAAVKEI